MDHARPAPRWIEVVTGVAAGAASLAVFAFVVSLGRYLLRDIDESHPFELVLLAALVSVATGLALWSWRLLSRRARRDGGLMSPTMLRVAGSVFILVPIVLAICLDGFLVIGGISSMGIGIALFLAARARDAARVSENAAPRSPDTDPPR